MSSSVLTKRASNRDSADPLRTSHEQSCFNFDLGFDFAVIICSNIIGVKQISEVALRIIYVTVP